MAKRQSKPQPVLKTATLPEALRILGIADDDWDALLVGDGSGNAWGSAMGWCCILIDHYGNFRVPFFGGNSAGTSQVAEIVPYIFAMQWYSSTQGARRVASRLAKGQTCRIHVVTDNLNVANQGNRRNKRNKQGAFWAALDHYETMGYSYTWHWQPRLHLGLNQHADHVAGCIREAIDNARESRNGPFLKDLDWYQFNPAFDAPTDEPIEVEEEGEEPEQGLNPPT